MALFKEDLTRKDMTNTPWLDAFAGTAATVHEEGGRTMVPCVSEREEVAWEPFDAQRKPAFRIAGPREA